jgi:hypothetical protein
VCVLFSNSGNTSTNRYDGTAWHLEDNASGDPMSMLFAGGRVQVHDDAFGVVHVPAVPLDPDGTTHFAPVRQLGPIVGSLSHAAPSAAGATHVPVVLAVGFTH